MGAPSDYGCAHCATAASLRGEPRRMPTTCPTRTHAEVASDPAPYLGAERRALMHAADALPFAEDGRLPEPVVITFVIGS
jgi:hypothetical protein